MVKQYPHKLYIDQVAESALDANGNWLETGVPFAPAIGDLYGGGIIFYVDSTGQHGLIAALADQSTGATWYNGTYVLTGATGEAVGTGDDNTNLILDKQGFGTYAASIARLYNGGEYNDWYLPSTDEARLLYTNLFQAGLGGFALSDYWTSTESLVSAISVVFAMQISFSEAYGECITTSSKGAIGRVRAIRAF